MKRMNLIYEGILAFAIVVGTTQCKKDDTSSTTNTNTTATQATVTVSQSGVTSSDITVAQNAESNDAVAEQVEQGVDNSVDQIESSGFSLEKSGDDCVTKTITAGGSDTTTFPKTIKLEYNCVDTVNGDILTRTGTVIVTIDTVATGKKTWWKKHLTRKVELSNFTVSYNAGTDSATSMTINGTRSMKRISVTNTISDKTNLRVDVVDSINSAFTCKASWDSAGVAKTASMTRNVSKKRESIAHYTRILRATGKYSVWYSALPKDSIIVTGTVSGVNYSGVAYTRTISKAFVSIYTQKRPYYMYLSSGELTFKVGTANAFTISYTTSSATPNVSTVTITRDGVSKQITRRIGKKFNRS